VTLLFIVACYVVACTLLDLMDEVYEFFAWLISRFK